VKVGDRGEHVRLLQLEIGAEPDGIWGPKSQTDADEWLLSYAHSLVARSEPAPWVHGLDISAHQGEVDWGMVPPDSMRFCYVKVSEGTGGDRDYDRDYFAALRERDVLVGAYAFSHPESHQRLGMQDAVDEASTFLDRAAITDANQPGDLVPTLDLERGAGKDAKGAQNRKLDSYNARWCLEWARTVRDALGYGGKFLLYTTGPSYWAYLREADGPLLAAMFEAFELTWAEYPRKAGGKIHNDWEYAALRPPIKMDRLNVPWNGEPAIWQWTGKGELPGFSGYVDRNVARPAALDRLRLDGRHVPSGATGGRQ
jgi:hypothetical protein